MYVRTDVVRISEFRASCGRFQMSSMVYHIFLIMVLRLRGPSARAELRYGNDESCQWTLTYTRISLSFETFATESYVRLYDGNSSAALHWVNIGSSIPKWAHPHRCTSLFHFALTIGFSAKYEGEIKALFVYCFTKQNYYMTTIINKSKILQIIMITSFFSLSFFCYVIFFRCSNNHIINWNTSNLYPCDNILLYARNMHKNWKNIRPYFWLMLLW